MSGATWLICGAAFIVIAAGVPPIAAGIALGLLIAAYRAGRRRQRAVDLRRLR